MTPLCHSNDRNRARSQIRTPNSVHLALAMLLRSLFLSESGREGASGACGHSGGCALISRTNGSGDYCNDEDLVPNIGSFLENRDDSTPQRVVHDILCIDFHRYQHFSQTTYISALRSAAGPSWEIAKYTSGLKRA